MSCYMVSEKTLNVVVAGLFYTSNLAHGYIVPKPEGLIHTPTVEAARKLFDKIYALNRKAVKDRYPARWKELMPKRKHKYDPRSGYISIVQFYKSLSCLTYQTSDADGESPLHAALCEYEARLAGPALDSTTDYANASWDL
jgi:hypothetical protein